MGVTLAAAAGLLPLASPAALAAAVAGPATTAAATPPAYATDLPNLSTPQVAYAQSSQRTTITPPAKGVAARGTDGALLYAARSGAGFAPFQSLGGVIVGDPSAVGTSNGSVDLFVRGTDNQVFVNTVTPSGAVTGYSLVPGLTVTGDIESIVPVDEPAGSVRIFARGPEGAVWTNVRRNGSWAGWSSLGGFITSDITASRLFSPIGGSIRIFVRGSDNRVYLNQVSPSGASGFRAVDDMRVTSNIAIRDSDAVNAFEIFARGEDNRVYVRGLAVTGSTWKPLDGVTATSDIAVTSQAVYVRGGDNAIYTNPQNSGNGSFTGFRRVEGPVTGNPAAFTQAGPFAQYLLARQPNSQLAFNTRADNGAPPAPFTGYTPISGPTID
ncbi:hypothetical protein D0T12_33275 [Actinomadura spongiicola]|uniref:PLL-like beta propeller domain-containing protein n=1 Tax=Actinomadura spongiicola TaxID=2303421 RepID=A0A372G776_9ACTN|nr:hypothetical protein [Actinomadura spongiicola]RFS81245.1 hypothetical protein D0T12_33275 [Actinomadura spongiicola]